jgi:hypothetical protein
MMPGTNSIDAPLQRADRNFAELLQEIRVLLTGVQVLLAFLLAIALSPFPLSRHLADSTDYRNSGSADSTSARTSAGVCQDSRLRGRALSSAATA